MKKKALFSILVAFILLFGSALPVSAAGITVPQEFDSPNGNGQGRYIVVFHDSVDPDSASSDLGREHGIGVGHIYRYALKGFSGFVPAGRLAELKSDPRVKLVELDLEAHITEQTLPTGVDRIDADLNAVAKIDGIDEKVDVDIAIIDTGIDKDHPDLNVVGGRHFYSILGLIQRQDDKYDDDNGHGSHCAGIAAAIDNDYGVVGVAPGARLWAIKVLDASGSGYVSDIVAGIDWVTQHASTIEVANMSLLWIGNVASARLAIMNSINAGVVYVVAAGNEFRDVYGIDGIWGTGDEVEPAAYPEVATISAMADSDGQPGGTGGSTIYGADDSFASFSDFSTNVVSFNPVTSPGAAIDLMMPGVNIYSTYKNGGYTSMSGTSMASPHAAGLAALYIAVNGRPTNGISVALLRQALIDSGVAQDSSQGLTTPNDPDNNNENIGWAGPTGPTASVSVTPSSQSGKGFPDNIVSYTYTVTNNGDVDDTYSLSTTSTWASLVTPTNVTLASGAWTTVEVQHTVSDTAYVGDSDTGTLTASSSDGTGASAQATFTTTAQGYAMEISPDSQSASGAPGDTITYIYIVQNTGTESDSYSISPSSSWDSFVTPTSLSLDAGKSAEVAVSHTIPGTAQDGESDTGTVTAFGSVSCSSTFTTTATVASEAKMHVESITITLTRKGRSTNWEGHAQVKIVDDDEAENPVSGATVTGDWYLNDVLFNPGASGITNSDGLVTINSENIRAQSGDVFKFTVTGVSHADYVYDNAANLETSDSDIVP